MKYKLAYYEDDNIRIEIKDNEIYYLYKTVSSDQKYYIDNAFNIVNYINDCLLEMRCSEHCGNTVRDK